MTNYFTTEQAAKQAGIHRITLVKWLKRGSIKASVEVPQNNQVTRYWTPADIEKLKEYSAAHRYEGRGQARQPLDKVLANWHPPMIAGLSAEDLILHGPQALAQKLGVATSWVYSQTRSRTRLRLIAKGYPAMPVAGTPKGDLLFSWQDVCKWLNTCQMIREEKERAKLERLKKKVRS